MARQKTTNPKDVQRYRCCNDPHIRNNRCEYCGWNHEPDEDEEKTNEEVVG